MGGFEAIIRDTSRLTTVCQSEEKLNGTYGPVSRNFLHDSLPSKTMKFINYEICSSDKDLTHPTRGEAHVDSFTKVGKTSKQRALLECERRFFDNRTEINFAEVNSEFCVNLQSREIALLVLDKRFCYSKSLFNDANDWTDCLNELGYYCVDYYVRMKACEREKEIESIQMKRMKLQKLMKMLIRK